MATAAYTRVEGEGVDLNHVEDDLEGSVPLRMLLILQEDIQDVEDNLSHVVLELLVGSLVNLWGLWLEGLLGCRLQLILLLLLFVLGFLFPLVRPFRLLFHLFKL